MERSDENIKDFVETFKQILPNPINYPKTTEYYWKVYCYTQIFEKKDIKALSN